MQKQEQIVYRVALQDFLEWDIKADTPRCVLLDAAWAANPVLRRLEELVGSTGVDFYDSYCLEVRADGQDLVVKLVRTA